MARGSGMTLEIYSWRIPIIPGALELAAQGLLTSGDKTNRRYIGEDVTEEISPALSSLLYDPQTAGGLLISIAPDRAEELLKQLRIKYKDASIIGRAVERGSYLLTVK